MEERTGVRVAGVGLKPDARDLARLDVARDQRRFACAGWPGDEDDRMLARCIEAAFRFLLDREPKESILGRFDVMVIKRYFPEFERELPRYLAPPP